MGNGYDNITTQYTKDEYVVYNKNENVLTDWRDYYEK